MWFLCALCQQRTTCGSSGMVSLWVVKKNECACAAPRAGGQGRVLPPQVSELQQDVSLVWCNCWQGDRRCWTPAAGGTSAQRAHHFFQWSLPKYLQPEELGRSPKQPGCVRGAPRRARRSGRSGWNARGGACGPEASAGHGQGWEALLQPPTRSGAAPGEPRHNRAARTHRPALSRG